MHTEDIFTVLCVDDEPNILSALRRALRPAGYQVRTAESGKAGLAILDGERVDLVISDMRMPEMDGAQFLSEVRERHPDIIRILLTGYSDMQSTIEAINRGEIYRYLSKPWDDVSVLRALQEAFRIKMLEREKSRLEKLTAAQNEELRALNQSLEDKVKERTEELACSNERLKQNFITSIKVFTSLIELRHGALAGHSRRVADLARKIAKQLSLDAALVQDVFVAGLLHDIGKIGLSDETISTPQNRLSGDRLGAYRKHASQGQSALMALDNLREVARLVRHHHERFDGKGFPDGLSGLSIPLGSKILAVANEFDALQTGAVTGSRMSADDAARAVAKSRSSRFDPVVVDAFLALSDTPSTSDAATARAVPVGHLEAGMVLARDLIGKDGVLLLAADFVIDANLVRQIKEYAEIEAPSLVLFIQADRIPQ